MNCWELRVILLVILTEALHFYFSLDAKVHTASKALVTTVLMGEYELSVGERWATPRPKRVNQIDESSGQKCLHRMSILPAGWFTERATCTKLSPWLVDWLRRPGQNSDILPLTTVPKPRCCRISDRICTVDLAFKLGASVAQTAFGVSAAWGFKQYPLSSHDDPRNHLFGSCLPLSLSVFLIRTCIRPASLPFCHRWTDDQLWDEEMFDKKISFSVCSVSTGCT